MDCICFRRAYKRARAGHGPSQSLPGKDIPSSKVPSYLLRPLRLDLEEPFEEEPRDDAPEERLEDSEDRLTPEDRLDDPEGPGRGS